MELDTPIADAVDQLDRKFCQYAQNNTMTWTLPADPYQLKEPDAKGQMPRGHGYFGKRCRLIAKHWDSINPGDWLPPAVIDKTPYSLTLLTHLAHLAGTTRHHKDVAHAAILEQRAERLLTVVVPAIVRTNVATSGYEHFIMEREEGVMLVDVDKAFIFLHGVRQNLKVQRLTDHTQKGHDTPQPSRIAQQRLNKRQLDLALQQLLQESDTDQRTELVGIEYSHSPHSDQANVCSNGPSNWQKLKKQVKISKKQARREQRAKYLHSGTARSQEQLLRALLASKAAQTGGTFRPSTLSQLTDHFKSEDVSWDDSDEDEEDKDDVLDESIDQEPEMSPRPNRAARRPINRLTDAVQNKKDILTGPSASESTGTSAKTSNVSSQDTKLSEWKKWRQGVDARSQRLPSEIINFSTLDKLQSPAEQAEIKDMTDAICDMLEGPK